MSNSLLIVIIDEDPQFKFNAPIPEYIKKLIEKCWDDNPDDRPTFDEKSCR